MCALKELKKIVRRRLMPEVIDGKFCEMCGDKNNSVGFSGCDHEEHKDIMICELCDIDGSLYNGWCHEAGEEGLVANG